MARRYKDHRGRFVTKEVYEWLQREKAAAQQSKTPVRPTDPDFSLPKTEYPEGFVASQREIKRLRLERGKFKSVTRGGRKAGEQRTRKSERLYQQGLLIEPVLIERTKRFETRIYLFEGLEGEAATLHVLDLYEDHTPEVTAMAAIESREYDHTLHRVGSPYDDVKGVKNWIGGWRSRASGQQVLEDVDSREDTRLIWELEIKIPNAKTKSSKSKPRRAKGTAKRSKQTNRRAKPKRQRSSKRRNVPKR